MNKALIVGLLMGTAGYVISFVTMRMFPATIPIFIILIIVIFILVFKEWR